MAIEPMHRSLENNLDACQHTLCKYIERWKVKGGIRDLEAARDLLIDYIDYQKTGLWKGKKMVTREETLCSKGIHRYRTGGDLVCEDCGEPLRSSFSVD